MGLMTSSEPTPPLDEKRLNIPVLSWILATTTTLQRILGSLVAIGALVGAIYGWRSAIAPTSPGQPPQGCANIAGEYDAKEKPEHLSVTQTGCFFRGTVQLNNEDAVAIGLLNSDNKGSDFVISHRTRPECMVRYFGEINDITSSGFSSHIRSTDGRCGMSTDWAEDLTWRRNNH
jgi:hypothetical protein